MPKNNQQAQETRQPAGRVEVRMPARLKATYAAHAGVRGLDLSEWVLSALADQYAAETRAQAYSAFKTEFARELERIGAKVEEVQS